MSPKFASLSCRRKSVLDSASASASAFKAGRDWARLGMRRVASLCASADRLGRAITSMLSSEYREEEAVPYSEPFVDLPVAFCTDLD